MIGGYTAWVAVVVVFFVFRYAARLDWYEDEALANGRKAREHELRAEQTQSLAEWAAATPSLADRYLRHAHAYRQTAETFAAWERKYLAWGWWLALMETLPVCAIALLVPWMAYFLALRVLRGRSPADTPPPAADPM